MVGVYPLFKRSAVNLSGAALRVHITVTTDSVAHEPQDTEELNSSVEDEEDGGLPTTVLSRPSQSPSKQLIKSAMNTDAPPSKEVNDEDTFIANITVDRAMHLSLKGKITTEITDFTSFSFASTLCLWCFNTVVIFRLSSS